MNRIETKIVVMVTNKLSSAGDSEAKLELIEELSENLYQRYLDLEEQGYSEQEALELTFERLGDVKELLAYLKSEGKTAEAEEKSATAANEKERSEEKEKKADDHFERKSEFYQAEKSCEKQFEQEMEVQIHAKETQAENEISNGETSLSEINVDEIHTVILELQSGDIEVSVLENLKLIDICTECEDLDITENEKGVLLIRQKKNRSGSGFFSQITSKKIEVELGLPSKVWDRIVLKSPNGDITVNPNLKCKELEVVNTSGNMEIWNAQAENVRLQTVSSDITAQLQCKSLYVNTVSGDVELRESKCSNAKLQSVSGDITASLLCSESLIVGTTSGDAEVNLDDLPGTVHLSTISGDLTIGVPVDLGFSLQYQTTSGNFSTGNLMFNGVMKARRGNVTYLDGSASQIKMTSVSGDMEIHAR